MLLTVAPLVRVANYSTKKTHQTAARYLRSTENSRSTYVSFENECMLNEFHGKDPQSFLIFLLCFRIIFKTHVGTT